ncbi:hypothetical protein DFH06DRAFT_1209332 [Mycena polygramma]|nr:hypothetical protein DFH06DRAFT_1209332 [Mycena polygramma]
MTSVTRPAAPPSDLPVPNSAPSHDMRVSALARALDLAREAVQLDSTTEQPQAAIAAYGRSVALLREVIASADREEEIRRLQNIHDTYSDRMHILGLIYDIPMPPLITTKDRPQDNSLVQPILERAKL